MTISKKVREVLKPTGVPVVKLKYSGEESTYITFFQYNEMGSLYADDEELESRLSIQVDVWSIGDYTELVKEVKRLMYNAGFRRNSLRETYEDDTKIFHTVIRYYYDNIGGI